MKPFDPKSLRRHLCCLFVALLSPAILSAQSDDLLTRIWTGEQQAQAKFTTACGTVTEIRTSKLMVKPLVLRGRFCAAGTDRFTLDYTEPTPMRLRLNGNILNVKEADGKTQVMNIASDIQRFQSSFSGKNSLDSLTKDFTVTPQEDIQDFELRLTPRSEGLRRRFNYIVVKLNKHDFLPRSLEVDGKSGVNSAFTFNITSSDIKLPEDTFEVLKPK